MGSQLAESEAKVAEAILADPTALEHYTITRLAQKAETSTSAVLRFCHSLGFSGYKDFRFELISEIRQQRTSDAGKVDTLGRAAEALAQAVGKLADLDRTTIARLASHIIDARTVFCVGIHRSFLPAEKLRMDLEDLGIIALSCRDGVQATHMANLVGEDSCVIIFSETGSSASYRAALDAGLAQQGHSWLITSSPHAQLANHVEHAIVLPSTRHAAIPTIDQHPIALAFVELLILQIREQLG
jgi:DNA-binding MurR/RpiR family transcriptional regulator